MNELITDHINPSPARDPAKNYANIKNRTNPKYYCESPAGEIQVYQQKSIQPKKIFKTFDKTLVSFCHRATHKHLP